jgi:hypothetical protein
MDGDTMNALNRIFVAVVASLCNGIGALYARHQLHYHRTSAADLRDNIVNERHAIAYHEAEARRIEFRLLDSQLAACRARET